MFTHRGDTLAQLFTDRRERRAAVHRLHEAIALALQSQARGDGPGPSDADVDRLGLATEAADRADAAYLRMLSRVADEVIASAKASAQPRDR